MCGWNIVCAKMQHKPQVRHLPNNQTFNEGNLEVSTELHGTWRPTPATATTLDGNLLGTIRVRPLLYEFILCSDYLNGLPYYYTCYRAWTELTDLLNLTAWNNLDQISIVN